MPGTFIVIDGTDGSGKTVQAKKLVERLQAQGRKVELLDFPRYSEPSSYFVTQYLKGAYGTAEEVGAYRASVFFALDRFAAAPHIREALAAGTILISNRYTASNKGHQMGKISDPNEQIAYLNWLNDFEYRLLGIPKPDLTVLLHVPAEIGFAHAQHRDGDKQDIHQLDIEHLRAAERAFLHVPEIDTVENWKVLECAENGQMLPIDEVHERLWTIVEQRVRGDNA